MKTDDESKRSARELLEDGNRRIKSNLLLRSHFTVELSSSELQK